MRRRLNYANVTATLALFFAMTGGALAAKKYLVNSTKQINPSVLKALKGNTGALGAPGAPGKEGAPGPEGKEGKQGKEGKEAELNRFARGVALAGVNYSPTGGVTRWFNQYGGEPKITKAKEGVYEVTFPGASFTASTTLLAITPDTESKVSTMVQGDYLGPVIVVQTYDGNGTTGTHADRQFHLLVYGASTTG